MESGVCATITQGKGAVPLSIDWYHEELVDWTPPEKLTISEWAEKYRILTEPADLGKAN